MKAEMTRRGLFGALSAALLALLMIGTPAATWADTGKDLTANDMVAAANQVIKTITPQEAAAYLNKPGVIFLDVREPTEVMKGKAAHSVNVPRGLLEFKAANELPDKDATIVVYCQVGARGALATETLGKMGYTHVMNIKGGWNAWVAAGLPAQ